MRVFSRVGLSLLILLGSLQGAFSWAGPQYEPFVLTPVPPPQPESRPVVQTPGGGADLSVDTFANTPDRMQYEPYNTFPRELDLWNLEGKKIIRSDVVVAPSRKHFAYSEVVFIPPARQTISKLYLVSVKDLPPSPTPRLPSEEATNPPQPIPESVYYERYDPTRHFQDRITLTSVGYSKVIPYAFNTLTVVDWSVSGEKLLYKQKSGVLHLGLKISDIWVADVNRGVATIYPAIHRVIKHYWKSLGNLPHMDELAWDIQPLGWEPGSDRNILLKAWAYDKEEKKYLGLWRYDLEADRTELLTLSDDAPIVAANGWIPKPIPAGKETAAKEIGETTQSAYNGDYSRW